MSGRGLSCSAKYYGAGLQDLAHVQHAPEEGDTRTLSVGVIYALDYPPTLNVIESVASNQAPFKNWGLVRGY